METAGGLQDARRTGVAADRHDQLGTRVAGDGDVVQDEESRFVVAARHRPRCGEATVGVGGATEAVPSAGRACG